MVSRSWGMALATLVSRITGFVRIVLLAAILGAALSSAFSVANQLPNLIAALVLEATFTAIFVPVLARAERDDPDGGAAFVRRLVTAATALLLATTVISVAAAPQLVRLMLGGDPQVNAALTTAFAYLLLPQVIFYGLSSVFMAILNNRNIFGPPAWAPVLNNVVAIATLVAYLLVPGELSVDPVRMGNPKLLVLGVGTTLGVVAQAVVLLVAIRREHISLRPLWGIDDRLKRFAAMAAAMVAYVLISQIGLVVGNQIASTAAASGPAIYNYTWLVLMLPFGMIGVTVLTVVMPRLSRNAAADNIPAVLDDFSLATRLTMITLIPMVAVMTVGGPAIGSALFAYGNFGSVDAGYLGAAIALSAFTLVPYALVLLQLRVFYAREQPWTPIVIIVVITTVKILGSLAAPHLTANPDMVAGFLGLANGLGFLAGAVMGHLLLRRRLRPRRPAAHPDRGAHRVGHHRRLAAGRHRRVRGRPAAGPGAPHRARRARLAAAADGADRADPAAGGAGADPGPGARRADRADRRAAAAACAAVFSRRAATGARAGHVPYAQHEAIAGHSARSRRLTGRRRRTERTGGDREFLHPVGQRAEQRGRAGRRGVPARRAALRRGTGGVGTG